MRFEEVHERLARLRFPALTTEAEGRKLWEFVRESGVSEILELGFAHGTSTCYMAAALDERGEGRITTMDRQSARQRRPNIEAVLKQVGLEQYVLPVFARESYNWELMKLIQQRTEGMTTRPLFDFCFLDGAHTWEADGFAFFLVDKLLRPGSWILFDDLHWTFAGSATLHDTEEVRAMPEEERSSPQVMKVVSLLALQQPGYGHLHADLNWAWVHKAAAEADAEPRHAALVERLAQTSLRAALRRRHEA